MAGENDFTDSYRDIYAVRNKSRQRKEQLMEYLGDMLVPQTEGFDHVNLDMTFTNLTFFDMAHVDNLSLSITLCKIYGLRQSEYLLRGMLASFLNSRRSKDAKSMDMFTTMVTKQKQEFVDKTESKAGFAMFGGFGRGKSKSKGDD